MAQDKLLEALGEQEATVTITLGGVVHTRTLRFPAKVRKDGTKSNPSPRRFSTGSAGYGLGGWRVSDGEGREYIVSLNVPMIGSKDA